MNRKRLKIIAFCTLLALGLSFLQYNYFRSLGKKEPETGVLVAKEFIPTGEPVNGRVEIKHIPASAKVKSMVENIGKEQVYARTDISEGSYILKDMVSVVELPVIKDDTRRVIIAADMVSALAGKIKPGDKVDIGFVPSGKDVGSAEIKAYEVPVLEVFNEQGEPLNAASGSKNEYQPVSRIPAAVALAVTGEQGLMLKELETRGKLFLLGY
ncbi:RcpC/CpaB family pilus assembly protein [Zhaonella formicivorans]|uniref:RcpC/CpaB family pilus assembly protein n=1 Tax=Zhaonella formicivorans TaxID=2528593 RepID=UPI0010D2F021|nr:RcpC/CpaB family pilus assembly protein [Zhaonella formicivorans]